MKVPKRIARAFVRLVLFLVVTIITISCWYRLSSPTSVDEAKTPISPNLVRKPIPTDPITWNQLQKKLVPPSKPFNGDPPNPKEITEQNYVKLFNIMDKPIGLPKVNNLVEPPADPDNYERTNATLMILARNRDSGAIVFTMKQIEAHFNKKFHYPYVFLSDTKFTNRFKKRVQLYTSSKCYFELIDQKDWKQPDTIDKNKQNVGMLKLAKENVAYARKLSYHNMCRYYSRGFYNHPRMRQFKYYWRFEPGTKYYCDIDYDVFKFMRDNEYTYGFALSLYDIRQSIKTLWPKTLDFVKDHMDYINPNGAFSWLVYDLQKPKNVRCTDGYSTCHFWSNFEIGDMDFFRDKPYSDWVEYLDQSGGFYYERWGDAPVHTLGLSLFEDKNKIHWFRDFGYTHNPYTNCPASDKCSKCIPGKFSYTNLRSENCLATWWDLEMDDAEKGIY